MGASLNKVQLIGRLGKNPEVRNTSGGASVANFSLATDESYKNRAGEKQQKTEWHNIVVWGPSVDNFVAKYLKQGDLVYLEGKIQTRSWDDKEGNKKYTTEINVTDIKKLSFDEKKSSGSPSKSSAPPAQEVSDEDIPF